MGFHNKISGIAQEYIAPASIILSVFIIIISLLEQSNEYRLDADLSLRTAHRLETLYNRFETNALGLKQFDEAKLRREYAEILVDARTHRKSVDYLQFRLENADVLSLGQMRRGILQIRLMFSRFVEYGLYSAMIAIPPLSFIILYFMRLS